MDPHEDHNEGYSPFIRQQRLEKLADILDLLQKEYGWDAVDDALDNLRSFHGCDVEYEQLQDWWPEYRAYVEKRDRDAALARAATNNMIQTVHSILGVKS